MAKKKAVKKKAKKSYKLDLFRKFLPAIDRKDYDFYDNLTEEERKGFSAFMGLKYGANIKGNYYMQYYYLLNANNSANIHLFDLSRFPKLQWLMLASISPGKGIQKHYWVKVESKKLPNKKRLMAIYPNLKEDDIDTLCSLVTIKELDQYDIDSGK